ncbi:hypothetical protein E4U54_001636 [Claviceps lovelessii]|nr:hypothetical protein E4U54_001636 [Claviceps lovelessii]
MHFSTSIALATALLAGKSLAGCGEGSSRGPASLDNAINGGACEVEYTDPRSPLPNKWFHCKKHDNVIMFAGDTFILNASPTDSTIRVNCGPLISHYYYCTADHSGAFRNPCAESISGGITVDDVDFLP